MLVAEHGGDSPIKAYGISMSVSGRNCFVRIRTTLGIKLILPSNRPNR